MKKATQPLFCHEAIMNLMSDYQPRTSEMIADLTGFSHGRVRSELARNFNFAKESRTARGGGIVTWHSLRKNKLTPISELLEQGAD